MPVKAREGGTGRVRTGKVGAQQGGGSSPGSPTGDPGGPAFQTDFTSISALPTGISLSRATGGTRINSSGVRVTEAIDAPRFYYSYNGSLWVPKGLLDEAQRTNLLKDSGNQTTANWGHYQCAVSTSSTTGADNSNFMTLVTANSVNDAPIVFNATSVAITSGANHALSVDVKKTNWNYLYFSFQSDTAGHWVCIVVDLSTNTVTQTGVGGSSGTLVGTPTVTLLRNGTVRVEFIAAISVTTGYLVPGFAGAATGNVFTSSNGTIAATWAGTETFLIDAAQISPGSNPTSYIPTTSAAVTRSADILSSSSPLTGYLAAGPSVWEFQDETTGTIARSAYAAGAFDWPVNRWYRSMGVYPSGTDTSGHMVVGGGY